MNQFLFVLLLIGVMCSDLESTIKEMRQSEFGRSFLEKIQMNDPVEKIIRDIANFYNNVDRRLEEGVQQFKQSQEICNQEIKELKNNDEELNRKLRDIQITRARKQPRYDLIIHRFHQKNKMRQELDHQETRYMELREAEQSFFNYNQDQLDKAMVVIVEIRNKFIAYLSQRQNRQRKAAVRDNQYWDDDETPFNNDDDDDYDEEEEERQHNEKYAFIQIIVAIQRVKGGLEMNGVTQLVQGIEDLCQQMHDIKEGNIIYDDSEETLNKLASQVIDITASILDWIAQVKRREEKADDSKGDLIIQTLKLINKQKQQADVEISQLANESAALSQQLNSLEQSEDLTKFSITNNKDLLSTKIEMCNDQEFAYKLEKRQLEEQLNTVGLLLEAMEQKGGQFKRVMKTLEGVADYK
ncbi:unnamed protein product [Paramecium sonneborni]|uniref:Uncharacterized protein n=1 Tax=Paramecium sonneborni TaxID=65129 RepID=A0A8S1QDK3_9CILI|nr:unnamed protein product [Paramecium sonneborni]